LIQPNKHGLQLLSVSPEEEQSVLYQLIEQGGYLCSREEEEKLPSLLKRTSNLSAILYLLGSAAGADRSFLICRKPFSYDGPVPVAVVRSETTMNRGITMDAASIEKIVQQLNEFQPDMLGGYPSNLELLIDEAKEGRLQISPVIIMTGGEYLSDELRARLADTFHCYVQTSYSCTEGGTVACECRQQHFHVNDDWLIVEPVDVKGNPVPDGVLSDKIYLTNLYNYTQPYIRYEVTDRVIMHHEQCTCGNPAPWLELEGRCDDVTTFMKEGKEIKIAPLSIYAVLKEVHTIRRFQVLVYPDNKMELRIEEKEGEKKEAVFEEAKACLEKFMATQGVESVTITLSEDKPRQNQNSGKFKHIINVQSETKVL